MSTNVSTTKELGTALKNKESTIYINGKLGDAVIAINAVGPVAWAIAIGAIGVALAGVFLTVGTGGAGAPVGAASEVVAAPVLIASFSGVTATTAVATSSISAASLATTAIGIAAAGGGVGVLTSMRKYKAKKEGDKVILTKRW